MHLEAERRVGWGVLDLFLSPLVLLLACSPRLPYALLVIRPLLGVTARDLNVSLVPNSLCSLFLSSSSAFFSPAASLISAALVRAGFLMDPRPEAFLERVVALASVCGSQVLSSSPASPWRR